MIDIVYVVGPGTRNDPLYYSLRSIANLPHDRVWIAGYQPPWVQNVTHIPVQQGPGKHANTWANWRAIAESGPENFYLFNDDFFVMQPVETVPVWHRGPLGKAIAGYLNTPALTNWRRRAEAARTGLVQLGHQPASLSWYELHTPMPMNRTLLVAALADLDKVRDRAHLYYAKRTWYGNHARIGGTERADCKTQRTDNRHLDEDRFTPFLSTSDRSWRGAAGDLVRATFTQAGPYEIPREARRGRVRDRGRDRDRKRRTVAHR